MLPLYCFTRRNVDTGFRKAKKKKCFCSTSILFHRYTHLCPCLPARPPARAEKNKTELEVQIILSACSRPRSPVWIPVLLLLLLLLRPSPFTSLLISPLRSAPDSFRLYRQRHLICFGKNAGALCTFGGP